jgi:hypothetical protein
MKGFLAMVVGGLGLGALLRRRRQQPLAEIGPDPADELRARLAQSKVVGFDEDEVAETAEATKADAAEVEAVLPDPGSRRQDVHDRARQAIEKLR